MNLLRPSMPHIGKMNRGPDSIKGTGPRYFSGGGVTEDIPENSGWIKFHRKFLKWEWADSYKHVALFFHLLMGANYKQTKWRGQIIEPGQMLTGRKKLSKLSGLTERSVRTVLKDLKTTGEVTSKTHNKFSIITIVNWKKYQLVTSELTSKRPASDQQATTSKKLKKVKKNTSTDFQKEIINIYTNNYPRKEGKTRGVNKLCKEIKSEKDLMNLKNAVKNYTSEKRGTSKKYLKLFSTFAGEWRDWIKIEELIPQAPTRKNEDPIL